METTTIELHSSMKINMTEKLTNTSDDGVETVNISLRGDAPQGKLITVGISTPITVQDQVICHFGVLSMVVT